MDMGNVTMPLQLKNPMFEAVGSHSLPIKIQRTRRNDLILKIQHPGTLSATKRFPAQLYLGALPLNGEFIISTITSKYYEGHYTTGNSTFRSLVADKKLTDVSYTEEITGSSSVSFTDALEVAARSSYPTHKYTCFPMLAPEYYDDQAFTNPFMINPWTWSSAPLLEGFVDSQNNDLKVAYAPSFYLCFVLQQVFESFGYTIEVNDIYDDTEMRTLVVPSMNTKGIVNTRQQYDLTFEDSLPPIGINEFIAFLENKFNLTFFIGDQTKTVVIKKNPAIVKASATKELKLVNREFETEEHDGFLLSYTMDPGDTWSAIKSIEGYTVGVTLDNKEDLASVSAGSYTNQLAKITNNDLYYISKLTDPAIPLWEWELFTKDFFEYSSDNKKLEIHTEANPILTDNGGLYQYYFTGGQYPEHAIFPRIGNVAASNNGFIEYKTFDSLRLLFFRGIVDSGGRISDPSTRYGQYPLASSEVYRPTGTISPAAFGRTKITSANMTLRWGGTYGLYNTHWKDYLYWWQSIKRPAKDYYAMSLQDLLSIKFWEKYRADGLNFLFRNINLEIDFARDTIRIGECDIYLS